MKKNFLERLQEADERTKRRVVAVSSALAMIVVVFLWFSYFNSIVRPEATVASGNGGEEGNFSFMDTIRHGTASMISGAWDMLRAAGRAVFEGRSYTITP